MTSPRRALIVIDVQQEYFHGALPVQHPPREESVANVLRAMDRASEAGMPTVVVQHESPAGAPAFAPGTPGFDLHPEVQARADRADRHQIKHYSSVFAETGLADWLAERQVDTVTLVGYMTNNCVLASAAGAEPLGLTVEVLADATGAVHLGNDAGHADAADLHVQLLTVLHSHLAAVTSTQQWAQAVADGRSIPRGNLVDSARRGAARHTPRNVTQERAPVPDLY